MPIQRFQRLANQNARFRLARSLVRADSDLITDLVALRKERGLTQEQVAGRMKVSQSSIARFESGARDARLSTIRRYAMAVDACVTHEVRAYSGDRDAVHQNLTTWSEVQQRPPIEAWRIDLADARG